MQIRITIATLLLSASLASAQLPEKWSGTADVTVDCTDEQLKSMLTSYVTRELRSLGDITITSSNPEYSIAIVAVEHRADGRRLDQHSYSTLITLNINGPEVINAYLSSVPDDTKQPVAKFLTGASFVVDHAIYTGPDNRLKESIAAMVAELDTKLFEHARTNHRRVLEQLRRQQSTH